jgi:hypothetical protein
MSVYTDPWLLDVRGARGVLPAPPLDRTDREAARANGTEGEAGKLAPEFAPTRCEPVQTETTVDKLRRGEGHTGQPGGIAVSGCAGKGKHPLATSVSGCHGVGATGLEPVTPSVSSKGTPDPTGTHKGLAAGTPVACSNACTSEPTGGQAGSLQALAAALLGLSSEDRAKLAAMLLGQQATQTERGRSPHVSSNP